MKYSYFPGCTLPTQMKNFELTVRWTARRLGIELEELDSWQCCQAVFPLSTDSPMGLVASFRALINAHQAGRALVTCCSGCFHVIKRTAHLMARDQETRQKLEAFCEQEYPPEGVQVLHYLDLLLSSLESVQPPVPLKDLRVGAYYGCLLLRPEDELGFDDPEDPQKMERLVRLLGAEPVLYAYRTECCGSYSSLLDRAGAEAAVRAIVSSARRAGAQVLVTSCPLCFWNLEESSLALATREPSFAPLPVLYFTQLVALALAAPDECLDWSAHRIDPRPAVAAFLPEVKEA